MQFPCTHSFCEACAQLWLRKQQNCPLCRAAVASTETPAAAAAAAAAANSQALSDREMDSIWEIRNQQREQHWSARGAPSGGQITSGDTLLAEAVAGAVRERRRRFAAGSTHNTNTLHASTTWNRAHAAVDRGRCRTTAVHARRSGRILAAERAGGLRRQEQLAQLHSMQHQRGGTGRALALRSAGAATAAGRQGRREPGVLRRRRPTA